ncbi:Carboxylic ester hydrolase [Pleurostoma richardsiae]|uniref:Carboxylic ester hydrolase n=1 Tax=Pleurostoma richardsiae TaxID=41990 RepID=A0AA38RFT1_9PEZI|nr:Carboxylic ester hydrolase [Pleurostoma richardsiae]
MPSILTTNPLCLTSSYHNSRSMDAILGEVSSRPQVVLRQGVLVGVRLSEALPQPIDAFLGVPYALPPIGDRRFRPAARIPSSSTTVDASKYGPAAPGKQLRPGVGPELTYSEDCLTANIFRPNLQPDPSSKRLPVAVYIHGGAFNRGTSSMHNTASMVSHSEEPFVAVSFNYRIGALGFLPSAVTAKEGALNLGLRDQAHLLEWVHENVAAFGGNPDDVTLIGLSAGAHSIGHHLMHFKDGVAPLFHRAVIESGAPTSRAVRPFHAEIHEEQFRDFLREVGCPENLSEDEIFPFLRRQSIETISAAQAAVFDKYNPSLRWAFQPVIDQDIIPRPPIETWALGRWHKVPIMTGFNGNEGSLYVEKTMAKSSEFVDFFRELLPLLSEDDLQTIDELYPDPAKSTDSPYIETRPGLGAQYKRIEAAYGHYAYVAPSRQTAELASAAQNHPVYLYHWALITSVEDGARHGDNMKYEVCDPAVCALSPAQKELAGTLNAYITSFITKGDPNAVRGPYSNRPKWEPYDKSRPKAMLLGGGNEELIGGGVGKTAELVDDEWGRKECQFWWSKVDLSQQ